VLTGFFGGSSAWAQAASNQTQSASLIGRDVKFRTDQVQLGTESTVNLQAELKGSAKNVTWTVLDENGRVVRTIHETEKNAGTLSYAWDGKGDDGKRLPPGRYKVRVAADDGDGDIAVERAVAGRTSRDAVAAVVFLFTRDT
jgi:flagellar basal-body rod modification protein FlgD